MSPPYCQELKFYANTLTIRSAYNDMLYLCEKYGPLESLEKYDPAKDVMVTKAYIQHETAIMTAAM